MNLFSSIVNLIIFSIINFPPISAENPNFTTCSRPIKCGTLTNITYPFYDGKTRPDYCGHPGFKLNCDDTIPQITISNQDYNLLAINNSANTIKISINNFNSTNACPNSLTNSTFNLFNFPSTDQNLFFFYNCDAAFPNIFFQTECDLFGSGFKGFYLTQSKLETMSGNSLLMNCNSVVIPILQSEAELIAKSPTLPALVKAFKAGFELGLIAGITGPCSSCVGSGGACGSDSGKFVCYCVDGDSDSKCGVVQVKYQDHHNHITALALGASMGGIFLLASILGGCCLILRKKQVIKQDECYEGPLPTSNDNVLLAPTSQVFSTSSNSTTYSHSVSSYTSTRGEDERASAYFGVPLFDYSELQQATNDFDDSKELGSGGYGRVYYGKLPDGRQVAVKRLYETSFRRMEQFMNEVEILARLRHKNLVTLYGCTSRKSRALVLVYEYVASGTVADHLHGKHAQSAFLKWPVRLGIALETAEALAYLHRSNVIHRDVKTTNILLDDKLQVKVADFGLARLFSDDATHVSTFPQGTPGYVDPGYYKCFRLTEKSDVYSFGVVLIELISSMQAMDGSRDVNLATMALDRIQNRALHELVDPRLGFEGDCEVERMVKMVAELGFRCLQEDKDMRPTMEEAAMTLRCIQALDANSLKLEMVGSAKS